MSKFIILLCSAFSAFASEASTEASSLASEILNDTPPAPSLRPLTTDSATLCDMPAFYLRPAPLRRQTRLLSPETIDYVIHNHTLKWRLITMVQYVGTNGITEQHLIDLIKKNPGKSNPYSDSHQAHIIALACRDGRTNIVSAIIENNPEALNCNNYGCAPLDESIAFGQMELAQFLRKKGAIRAQIDANECLFSLAQFLCEKDAVNTRPDVIESLLGLAQLLGKKGTSIHQLGMVESLFSIEDDNKNEEYATEKTEIFSVGSASSSTAEQN